MKLYELTSSYSKILEMIQEGTEGLDDTLESLQGAIEEKAENIAKIIRTIDAECEAIKTEENRLSDRRKALERRRVGLRLYIEEELRKAGIDKVKTPLLTIGIQNNPPSVSVVDEGLIPEHYWIQPLPQMDRTAILNALKQGKEVPGVKLQQTSSLRIR